MAVISVNLTDTFEQWRTKTNSLGTKQGDLTTLTTTAKGTVVAAINEVDAAGGMANLVEDTTPQLGGSLDMNGNSIISVSNANITITPNGSGKVILDGISHPAADGTNGQVLQTNGSGVLSFATISSDPTMGGDLSGTASNAQIVANSVTATELAGDAVTGAQLADNACDSEHYTDGSIDTAHIANDQITAALIADNAIDSDMYVDGSIDTAHLAADAVDGTKIADDAINSEHYAADSIDTEHYAAGSVDNTALGADCVTHQKVADNTIYAVHIVDGSCSNAKIATDAITNVKVADDAIGVAELSASGTANSSSFLRGDNTWAAAGGGKVLQMVQHAERNTPLSITPGTATWTDISGLSVSITPSATSSKVLVGGHVSTVNPGDHNGRGIGHRILRGSTVIGHAAANGSRLRANSFNAQTYNHGNPAHPLNYLDSPNTTSAVTYKFQVAPLQHNQVLINYGPASSNANSSCDSICYIYVIEIGA
jgi:hypothetical protein